MEVKNLMFEALEMKDASKIDRIEEMSKTLTERKEKALESLRNVIGI